jgi:hypothetical protein
MWHSTILLHRPFISRSQPPAGSSDSSEEPLMVCHQAATNICLVLEKYFGRLHGLPCELVFSIFTAATIFLYHSQKSDGEARVASEQQVKLCAHWLSVLGKSWKGTGAQQQLHLDREYRQYSNCLNSTLKPNSIRIISYTWPCQRPVISSQARLFGTALNGSQQWLCT